MKMMKRILEFFKSNKYAIVWTACYVCVMWIILWGLFGFDMFSAVQWSRLLRAQLRGFPGFVFGILILSALPLYVATTVLVVRNKAPLLTIPVPEKIKTVAKKLIPAKKAPAAADATATTDTATVGATADDTKKSEFPDAMPSELRGAFVRARQHIGRTPASNFDTTKMVNSATTAAQMPELMPVGVAAAAPSVTSMAEDVPLPSDFDFDADVPAADDMPGAFGMGDAPMFKDITFGDADASDAPAADTPVGVDVAGGVQEFLTARGVEYTVADDGLVRVGDMAIAVHDDAAFWIADADAWFATGQQKPSPIAALHAAARDGVRPVLYLAQSNVMDIDALRAAWSQDGILVIDNLDALPI